MNVCPVKDVSSCWCDGVVISHHQDAAGSAGGCCSGKAVEEAKFEVCSHRSSSPASSRPPPRSEPKTGARLRIRELAKS